ncbi:MAG TPA: hypothetical protein ENN13_03830 [Candidatus Altiarchaeales archaeon]|mgnify:CR=1 FL=1|nr:hypothetical protein [Candidatus Altiarchaeales archaeon]
MAKKDHGILPLDALSKISVKINCDKCGREEYLADYEKNIEARKFAYKFRECPGCRTVWCETCFEGGKCPVCGKPTIELKPADIFICHYCLKEWFDEGGLCGSECKYHK